MVFEKEEIIWVSSAFGIVVQKGNDAGDERTVTIVSGYKGEGDRIDIDDMFCEKSYIGFIFENMEVTENFQKELIKLIKKYKENIMG